MKLIIMKYAVTLPIGLLFSQANYDMATWSYWLMLAVLSTGCAVSNYAHHKQQMEKYNGN